MALPGLAASAQAAEPARVFEQTGFRISNAAFLDFFDRRGGLRTFGYPVSREFTLQGSRVQFFQRAIMQLRPDGSVTTLNFLDAGLMPYDRVNKATLPAIDPALLGEVPKPGSPGYDKAILAYVQAAAPDVWQSLPVNFHRAFLATVGLKDAFPGGKGNAGLLAGFALELWGAPTSAPTLDPANHNFVYQRFQRGIMHFDRSTGLTQGLLLADYLKAILTGDGLPADLDAQAKASALYKQYDPGKPGWLARPNDLPQSDLTKAFEREAVGERPTAREPVSTRGSGRKPVVAIDAGHGGPEIGTAFAFPDGFVLREKDVTLPVANRVAALLREAGYEVVQTRTADRAVNSARADLTGDRRVSVKDDLQARLDIANNAQAALFLAIHFNGLGNRSVRGTEVYYCQDRPFAAQSRHFADLLRQRLLDELKGVDYASLDRGIKDDQRALGRGRHYYLLGTRAVRPSRMPGAIAEGLFLTNPSDAARLRDPRVLEAIAQGYAKAVRAYFEQ
jgi:N-acetylmuramoyl-L-alanine amidase